MQTQTTVAVIILTVNQKESTLRVLGSFTPEDRRRARFLLWDNGSIDGTGAAVRTAFPEVHVHEHACNLGVASGRNAAAALCIELFQATHLLFLDNDVVVKPDFTEALLEPFALDSGIGQTQAKLLFLSDPSRINDGGGCRVNFWLGRTSPVGYGEIDQGQRDRRTPCIACGGAMMVRTDVFEELGGFDSGFDPFGPEDLDFSLRLQKAGYRALYTPRAVAHHEVSHTFEGGNYTNTYARSKARHWLRFMRRHASPAQKLGFMLFGAPLIAAKLALREGLRGNPGALLGSMRGVIEAMRHSS